MLSRQLRTRLILSVLGCSFVGNLAFAQDYSYRLPLYGLKPAQTPSAPGGAGNPPSSPGGLGELELDSPDSASDPKAQDPEADSGVGQGKQYLSLSPALLDFQTIHMGQTASLSSTLTNVGTAPTRVTGFQETADYAVQHNCDSVLAVGAACTVAVTLAPASAGTKSLLLELAGSAGGSATLLAHGSVTRSATAEGLFLELTPRTLKFANVAVGYTATQSATVRNVGTQPAQITGVGLLSGSKDYAQSNDCGAVLAVGESCTLNIAFTPSSAKEAYSAVLLAQAQGPSASLPLSGIGQAAQLYAEPGAASYGLVKPDGATHDKTVTVRNTGNLPLNGLSTSLAGEGFRLAANGCGPSLAPAARCDIIVEFTPVNGVTSTGSLKLTSANGGAVTVNLSGTGGYPAPGTGDTSGADDSASQGDGSSAISMAPSAVDFGTVPFGSSTESRAITVKNIGSKAVTFDSVGVSSGREHFGQSNDCGTTLAPGETCTIMLAMAPAREGAVSGVVSALPRGYSPVSAALYGKAEVLRLTASPTSLSMGSSLVGQASSVAKLTLTNSTLYAATISGMGMVEGGEEFSQSNNCGTSLAAGASCEVNGLMTPREEGARSGTLGLVTSFGTQTVAFSGVGTVPRAALEGFGESSQGADGRPHFAVTFPDTAVSQSSTRTLTLRNSGSGPLGVAGLTVVSGASDFGYTSSCGATVAPGGSCTIALKFNPSAADSRFGQIALATSAETYHLDLSGKGTQLLLSLTPVTSADFGLVGAGTSATRNFTVTNTSGQPATGVYAEVAGQNLAISSSGCGTPTTPVSLAGGAKCTVQVKYSPTAGGTMSGTLTIRGNFHNSPLSTALTGTASTMGMAWSSSYASTVEPTAADNTWPQAYAGAAATTKVFYVRRVTGTTAPSLGFTLSDTRGEFRLVSVMAIGNQGGTVGCGATIAADGLSSTPCKYTGGTGNPHFAVTVRRTPMIAGNNVAQFAAYSYEGTPLPPPTTIQDEVLPIQTEWSLTAGASGPAPSLDFGKRAVGTTLDKVLYLRNVTSFSGVAAAGFTLTGASAGQFRIVSVSRGNDTGGTASCNPAVSIAADGQSTNAVCTFAPTTMGHVRVVLRYSPTYVGAHEVQIVPHTNNGTLLPGPLTLTGTTQ